MNRRLFCQFPLVASAILANAHPIPDPQPRKGFKVESGKDRFDEELLIMGGQFDLKVSAKDTGGGLCVYDTFRDEKGGPALHRHFHQDEWFFVLSGEFVVKVGDDVFHLKTGDTAFAPRQIAHAFAKISDDRAHMLILFQPAGSIEDFFREMSKLGRAIPRDKDEVLRNLFRKYDMELLGPPLQVGGAKA